MNATTRDDHALIAKGSLVAARLPGHSWNVTDVAIVLHVGVGAGGREFILVTERGVILTLAEPHARLMFEDLGDGDDSIFVLTYDMLSVWQVEEDHDAGFFDMGFAKARSLLASRRLMHRMMSTRAIPAR